MLFIFILAVAGLLYEVLIFPVMLLLCLVVYRDARAICIQWYQAASMFFLTKKSVAEIFFFALMGCAGILSFLAAATPPFFFDALVYHLAVPHKYLLLHRFHYIPHQPFSNFPMNFGMLCIVALSFSTGMLAKLLSWAYFPLSVLAVYGFAKSRWGNLVATTSATILFLVPGCLILSTLTAVDNMVMFYSFLCFSALLSWRASRERAWFIWAAVFCSLAIGVKYHAIVVTFLPAILLLLVYEFQAEKASILRGGQQVMLFSLVVLLGVSPWLAKNFFYTGNPLYPFFNALFGSQASYNVEYQELMRRIGNPLHRLLFSADSFLNIRYWLRGVWEFINAPWFFSMKPNGAAGQIGIIFLLFVPFALLIKPLDRAAKSLLICALSSLGLWALFLPWIQRYGFPILPLLSLIAAYALWNLPVSQLIRKLLAAILTIGLIYQLFLFVAEEIRILRPFDYLFANQTREEFLLDHGVNYYPVIQYVNRETSVDAKILFVGESRGYYCERDYLLYTVIEGIDDNELPLRNLIIQSQDINDLLQKLQVQGITHILLNAAEMKRYTETYLTRDSYLGLTAAKDQAILRALLSPQSTRELITAHQVRLYEILYQ